jgi:hypothetical protein
VDGNHFAPTDVANRRSFPPEIPLSPFHSQPTSKRWKILRKSCGSEGETLVVGKFVCFHI